jgi:hypothetical protein
MRAAKVSCGNAELNGREMADFRNRHAGVSSVLPKKLPLV